MDYDDGMYTAQHIHHHPLITRNPRTTTTTTSFFCEETRRGGSSFVRIPCYPTNIILLVETEKNIEVIIILYGHQLFSNEPLG